MIGSQYRKLQHHSVRLQVPKPLAECGRKESATDCSPNCVTMTDTRKRVKLYALNADRQWDDRGTGHVASIYVERLKVLYKSST